MPRFFLHICNGNGFTEDQEGQDLPDLAAAREAAIKGLRDILAGEMRDGEMNLGSFIEIEDEGHRLLMTVPTDAAINVTNERGSGRDGRKDPPDA